MQRSRPPSFHGTLHSADDDDDSEGYYSGDHHSQRTPTSRRPGRRLRSTRTSEIDLRSRLPPRTPTESDLVNLMAQSAHSKHKSQPASGPGTPRQPLLTRHNSVQAGSTRRPGHHSRSGSFGLRLANALGMEGRQGYTDYGTLENSKVSLGQEDRVWYDQFTSTDWVHDSISDAYRLKALRARKDIRGRLLALMDGAQGWVLVAIIGILTACVAYFVDVTETTVFDYKTGYCSTSWWRNRKRCCNGATKCDEWHRWSRAFETNKLEDTSIEYLIFIASVVLLACLSCALTLTTKNVISSAISISTLDEDLGAGRHDKDDIQNPGTFSPTRRYRAALDRPPMVYYSAAGSGVAEVKVILSGFVLHRYLGLKTLVIKTLGLVLSVSSGLSLGKEGPYVHIATCIGNIACRLFAKYNRNDAKRREVLSASAASGVAVAFGAPIGGVLFSLEEVSYYFPPKTLFRTFFCCIAAALSLKFLDPYGTKKIVLFEVRYITDWRFFELIVFVAVGATGGALGALFIKASRWWATHFRRLSMIKGYPMLEVAIVAAITGIITYWNRYTRLPVAELLYELSSPCDTFGNGLCPTENDIPKVIGTLAIAFVIKAFLTTVTFGIKVPAGIYVPSMVVGGLMGRMIGHVVQYIILKHPAAALFDSCPNNGNPESCVVPGIYAMVAAGATMCGVTRLSVTLAVILFELTGSLDHVLPFSLGVLVAKWTADALEPHSIYDVLLNMNSYPFLDNKVRPIFTSELQEITPRVRRERIIDISNSPLILAKELRQKLEYLHMAGELDGGLPIVRDGILVGLIPAPDLEFALDKLPSEENTLCLMSTQIRWNGAGEEDAPAERDPTDFTPYIDPAPVTLDSHSPMDLVYEMFVKLGLRYVCVLRDGRFAGLVHKKAFVKYCKDLELDGNQE